MTISSDTNRSGPYVGAGTFGPFTVGYYFLKNADLLVLKEEIATGIITELVLTTDYTLTGEGDPNGGELTLTVGHGALPATHQITIIRDPDRLQGIDYTAYDKFPAETHERGLDKLTMLVQRVYDVINRTFKAPDTVGTDQVLSGPAWAGRASKALGFDAAGALTVGVLAAFISFPGTLDANRVVYTPAANTLGVSANLQFNGTQLKVGNGTEALPSIALVNDPDTGFFKSAAGDGLLEYSQNGSSTILLGAGFALRDTAVVGWSSGAPSAGIDTQFMRTAAGTIGIAQGGAAQAFEVYNFRTDAANYERVRLVWSANQAFLETAQAGTGVSRALLIGTTGATRLSFYTNTTVRAFFETTGHFLFGTDNALDIGANVANRPRTVYAGTSFQGGDAAATGAGFIMTAGHSTTNVPAQCVIQHTSGANNGSQGLFSALATAGGGDAYIAWSISGVIGAAMGLDNSDSDTLKIITSGAGTGGGLDGTVVMAFPHVASAVNYWDFRGSATGNLITVAAAGSDTNLGMQISSKGTGEIRFFTNGTEQVRIQGATAATRFIGLVGSNGGNPKITTSGGDLSTDVAFRGTLAITSSGATAGIGYATGAGGTVTQITSKATGVTLNTITGHITMHNAALAAATNVTFVFTNSAIGADDSIIIHHRSAGTTGAYDVWASNVAAGSCSITVRNQTAGSLSEAIVLKFSIIKGVSA